MTHHEPLLPSWAALLRCLLLPDRNFPNRASALVTLAGAVVQGGDVMALHLECGVGCTFECKNNIHNNRARCPFCGSDIQIWRLTFALTHLDDEKVVADSVSWAEEGDGPLAHVLIHVPESY